MELISREQVIATIDSFNVFESRSDQIKLELMIGELPIAGVSTNLASLGTDCSEFPNNSDAISRQAAIDDIWTVSPLARLDRKWIDRWLRQLPPIQPKRGRWVYCEDSMADCVDGYRCDQCGFFVPWDYQHKSIDYIKDYNFCPNCGADMRGEQDG